MTEVLSPNDDIVVQELKKHGASVSGKAPESLPKTAAPIEPALEKTKPFTVHLNAEQEARLIREGANRQLTATQYLQQVVDDALKLNIGRAYVSSATFMGASPKVVAPSTRSI